MSFSGAPIEFEDWELATKATIGQTAYASLLNIPPTIGNAVTEARDKELYNMFVTAFIGGAAMHILNGVTSRSGNAAWLAIVNWYGSDAVSRTIVDYYHTKLEVLPLNERTEVSQIINIFII